ncbi:TonB-dependent receptor [Rhodoferax sp.]|uniref:TonB-dependent receptor n=1 Tax=Rhodoferax sp. TaxID=50421 RepID=UPI0037845D38
MLTLAMWGAVGAHAQTTPAPALKEVVVSTSRFEEPAETLPYSVGVITAKDIETSGAASVSEALIKVLGLPGRLDTSGGNNYAVDLRGFGTTAGNNQVVIVDGRRLNDQDSTGSNLSVIPIDTVQRIEVMRGSGAVVYGEGATGGVIVITTKAGLGVARRNSAALAASTGSFGLRELRSSATVVAGGLSLDVSGSDRSSDGHRDNFASTNNGAGATLQWSNDWLRMGAQTSRNIQSSGLPGALSAAQYAANPGQAKDPLNYGRLKSEIHGLFVEAIVGDWQLGLDYGERTKQQFAFYAPSYTTDTTINATSTNLRARTDFRGAGVRHTVSVGADQGNWSYRDVGAATAQADSEAIYLTDDMHIPASGTRISVGLRREAARKSKSDATTQVDDSLTAWHLGLTQELGRGLQAFGRTGKSFRFANVDEINFVTPGASLKPQTSRDVELGARWNNSTSRAELRWYRSDLESELGYDASAIGPYSAFGTDGANVNFDPTQRQGVELELRHALTPALAVHANAALREARFVSGRYTGKNMALVPARSLGAGLDWSVAAGHQLNLGLTWVGSQSPDFDNACTMPAYSTLDARYAVTNGPVELAVGITNLADAKYTTQAFGCTAGVTSAIYPEAGRAFTATAKVRF